MKRIIAFIGVIVAFLAVALFTQPAQNDNTKLSQQKKIKIGILQLVSHPALDQIHAGIITGLKDEGFKEKKNITIEFQNAQGDQSNLKTMAQQIADRDDILFGIATPAAQALVNSANKTTPIIMAGISDPAGSGLVKSEKHPGANVTGSSGDSPLEKQLKLIQDIMPQAKNIGVIYTSSDAGGQSNAKKFVKLVKKAGLQPKLYTIANTNDMQQISQQMAGQVDAIYAPQDNGVASSMKTLVNNANQAGKPVFPAADTMVKDGGTAAYAIDQHDLGRLAGQMAGRVLKGKKTATYPVGFVVKGKYVLNQEQIDKLHIKIPAKIMQQAQKNGKVIK